MALLDWASERPSHRPCRTWWRARWSCTARTGHGGKWSERDL